MINVTKSMSMRYIQFLGGGIFMSQSLMINNIFPKIDKEVGMVLSCHCHLTQAVSKTLGSYRFENYTV